MNARTGNSGAPDEVSARQDREVRGQGSVRFHIVEHMAIYRQEWAAGAVK